MALPDPASDATVLVTGASAGIGTELARRLAELGHGLTLTARRADRLQALAVELADRHGVRVEVHPADLADPAARAGLIAAVEAEGRFVAGLCNNAGFGSYGRLDRLDPENETGQVRLNVDALHHLTAVFVRPMVDRGEGAILNVGSIAGFQPIPGQATYSATKAFVNSFSEALHGELHGTGVSCTVLCPGPVQTEFFDVAGAADLAARAPGFAIDDAVSVARQAVEGMRAGKRTVIPSATARAASIGGRFVPRTLFLPAARKLGGRRLTEPAPDVRDR